jgi:hypothetical protein
LFSKDTIFGESVSKKFGIGDIVSWPTLDKFDNYNKTKKIGIISKIETHIRSERPVIIAKVIDFDTSREVDILIVSLTLITKADKEIQN